MRTTVVSLENRNETDLTAPAKRRLRRLSLLREVFFFFFVGDFQDLSNNAHNNTPRVWTAGTPNMDGDGRFYIYFIFFFKYLIRLVEDNVKRPPPLRRRRRFIICRQKNLFYNATSSCLHSFNMMQISNVNRMTRALQWFEWQRGYRETEIFNFFFLHVRDASKCKRDSCI